MKSARLKTATRLVVAATAALLLPALATAPAVAHDSLASTDPARDAVLDTAPATVSLTLSDAPLDSAQLKTSVLKVADSTGKTLSQDDVQVNGATLSTAITAGQPGPTPSSGGPCPPTGIPLKAPTPSPSSPRELPR